MQPLLKQPPIAAHVPGVTFRYTVGEADADPLYAVHTARLEHDRVDPLSTVRELPRREDLTAMLSQATAAGQHDRVLVGEVGDEVVGYCRVTDWLELDGTRVFLLPGWVLPQHRGRGIGSAMIEWAEKRARVAAASDHPGERFEYAANATSTEPEARALLRDHGFRVAYTVAEMQWVPQSMAACSLPAGLTLRRVLPEQLEQLAESVRESYLEAWPGNRYSEELDVAEYAKYLASAEHDVSLWRVAWDGDNIAGQVLCSIADNRAEVFEVSVRPAWRRRGLARSLLTAALQTLVSRQVDAIRLHTVSEFRTKAIDLYRSLGFEVLKEHYRYRKPAA